MENDNSSSDSPLGSTKPAHVASDFAAAEAAQEASFRMPIWGKAGILLALVALASVGYVSGHFKPKLPVNVTAPSEPETQEEIAKRPQLRDFILTDADGKQKKLSDYRGNVVILSFWASWCTPCLVELPTFGEIEKKFASQGLKILAINVDEGPEGKTFARDFWGKNNFGFPSFFDADKAMAQEMQVDMLPSNFVVDREGRLVFSGFGANDWANSQTTDFLEGILHEGTAAVPAEASKDAAKTN